MWGVTRYLIIYLLSGLGSSCLSVAHQVNGGAGASGALCGILASEAIWVLLNRKYLPRGVVRTFRGNFIMAVILIGFISAFPGVDGWGHLGGAIVGAVVSFFLNWQRFGPNPWRWLAVIPVLSMPYFGYEVIERARRTNPDWQKEEARVFVGRFLMRIDEIMKDAISIYQKQAQPLIHGYHPTRRKADDVEKSLTALATSIEKLQQLAADLMRAGRYLDPDVEEARQKALEYSEARLRLMQLAERCLREGERFSGEDMKVLRAQEETVAQLRQEWKQLVE
jgi:hypothetical protein